VRTRRWKYIALRHRPEEIEAMKASRTPGAYLHVRGTGGDYPLALYPGYWDANQLYNLENDPGEQRNLASDPALRPVLEEMKGRLDAHLAGFPHPFPLEADPWTATEAYRALTRRNLEDRSIYEADWYRSGAW
jgi:hypothetical protein